MVLWTLTDLVQPLAEVALVAALLLLPAWCSYRAGQRRGRAVGFRAGWRKRRQRCREVCPPPLLPYDVSRNGAWR